MSDELRVYRRHITKAGICRSETQHWMESHGFDWIDFMRNGIPADALAPYTNVFVERVIAQAQKERDANG